MGREAGDTRERSLAHWSESGRAEMDAFYRVATLDYRELARAWDWDSFLRQRGASRSPVRILDVACGSGKFPTALRAHTRLGALEGARLVLDLLDPSSFSLSEARASLAPPMVGGRDFECTLQDLPTEATDYDVVWAVHALYALPETELPAGVEAFLRALAPDGLGFVAHAARSAHYLAFYEAYLSRFRPDGTPYTSAEAVAGAFREAGAKVEVRPLAYEQVIDDDAVLEGFLQRCLFDSDLSLADMRQDPVLGAYLEERRDERGCSRFRQDVSMIFIRR
ncbi:MAG: class I SAM-dependent methyltransferase [Myxococcota bacterium]|nr:class I SAM-dependent methyltransferase [Myxococcota bacterium]